MASGFESRWISMELFRERRQSSNERGTGRGAAILGSGQLPTGRAERIRCVVTHFLELVPE
jgi:hypothetical protein